jgi:large subunit ribosomal protein L10
VASLKNLEIKKETVNEIKKYLEESEAVILFTYHGLTVGDLAKLRRDLRETNSEVKVYKNTLVKLALADRDLNLDEYLTGPNAILFGKDLLGSIKTLDSFAKEKKNIEVKAGIIKGDITSLETIKEYASIPSVEGLLTMLAGGMIEHVKNLSIGLNLYAEKLEEEK